MMFPNNSSPKKIHFGCRLRALQSSLLLTICFSNSKVKLTRPSLCAIARYMCLKEEAISALFLIRSIAYIGMRRDGNAESLFQQQGSQI